MIDPTRLLGSPDLDEHNVWSVKLLAKGEASAEQQIAALEFILHKLAQTDNQSFVPNDMSGGQNTAFLEGRRFVGRELRRIILEPSERLLPPEKLARKPKVSNARN